MESPAVKAIVTLGVAAFVILGLTSMGLRWMIQGGGSHRAVAAQGKSPFDGRRAFEDLRKVVGFGPRVSGSEALAETRAYIKRELEKAGLAVREYAFDADTPMGTRKMVNVVGVVEGTRPARIIDGHTGGVVLLSNHYETKYFADIVFVGANDGGGDDGVDDRDGARAGAEA